MKFEKGYPDGAKFAPQQLKDTFTEAYMNKEEPKPLIGMSWAEMNDLYSELIRDLKKEYLKAVVAKGVLQRSIASHTIAGRMNPETQAINQNSLMMLESQVQGLPNLIATAKEKQFEAYEMMKKHGDIATK